MCGSLFGIDSMLTNISDLGGEKTYDKISDYVTTTAPAEAHSTVLTRNSSRSTTWYTPKQTPAITPDSSYTHIPAVVNKIPIFQLKMKRGVGGSNSDSYSHMPSQAKVDDILSYKEQISAWHKDRISNSVESESIATPLQSSGVGTPITTLDRYSYLNPRYGVGYDSHNTGSSSNPTPVQNYIQNKQTQW